MVRALAAAVRPGHSSSTGPLRGGSSQLLGRSWRQDSPSAALTGPSDRLATSAAACLPARDLGRSVAAPLTLAPPRRRRRVPAADLGCLGPHPGQQLLAWLAGAQDGRAAPHRLAPAPEWASLAPQRASCPCLALCWLLGGVWRAAGQSPAVWDGSMASARRIASTTCPKFGLRGLAAPQAAGQAVSDASWAAVQAMHSRWGADWPVRLSA